MLVQTRYKLPKEITSVAEAQQIVPQELTHRLANFLMNSADMQHRAEDDFITYYIEMILLTVPEWREIRRDLVDLEMLSLTREQADRAKSIRMKLERL